MPELDAGARQRIRQIILDDVERALDPTRHELGSEPSDFTGWVSAHPRDHAGPQFGKPVFVPQAWRHFRLVDIAHLGDAVWINFRWDEDGTPDLDYLFRVPIPAGTDPASQAFARRCRASLRILLAPVDMVRLSPKNEQPGWRHRATRTWLDPHLVVVSTPTFPDYPSAPEAQSALEPRWDDAQ